MKSRIAQVLVEEANFTKNTTAADVEGWAKKRYTSYFSKRVLVVIERNARTVAEYVNDYWKEIEEHNAETIISQHC